MANGRAAQDEGGAVAFLRPRGSLDRSHVSALWRDADRALQQRAGRLVLDLREVATIDGAGVALVHELEDRCRRKGIRFSVDGAAPAVAEFLAFVHGRSGEMPQRNRPVHQSRKAAVRAAVTRWGEGFAELLTFIGRFAKSAVWLVTHPHRLRVREVLYAIQQAGAEGMLLIITLSLLLGVIMAFQGLGGARSFGSPIYVADIVTLSTTREMAPLLTGVIVTGRTGAAIAAEIATMKIDQELDALKVMGFDAMQFLLLPRTIATMVATPLLTMISIAFGILGGASVAVFAAHLPIASYFGEVQHALGTSQIVSALAKGVTFGLMIGGIACFQGLRTGHAAEDVGRQTTSAVVKGILLVIVADAFFSIITEVYAW